MRKYFFQKKIEGLQKLSLEGDLFKHIFKVCRHQEEERFELLSFGKAYLCEVEKLEKTQAHLKILEQRDLKKIKRPYIHLVLANPKPAVFEAVVEKAVELSVKTLRPVVSDFSFFKSVKKLEQKQERIEKIAFQAMQQSGRGEALELLSAQSLESFFSDFKDQKNAAGYFFYEKPLTQEVVPASPEPQEIYILIGGEGGFSEKEADHAVEAGLEVVHLGDQVMRVETACVAGISILKSKFDLWLG